MASLWRACVGPDITVYVRECSREEVERVGAVEIRLADFRTVVLRKSYSAGGGAGASGVEEKVLRRMGFEIEDYLTQ
jgi:HMG box factor